MPFAIDYFISRRGTHASVAQEVAEVLDSVGATSFSQDYDIARGDNFIGRIHDALGRCEHFIALLTSDYADAAYTKAEWTNFYSTYVETNGRRRFIVIRLEDCEPPGLLRGIVYEDLVGVTAPLERRRRIIAATEGRSAPSPQGDWLFENVPARDLNFTGRDRLLAELHKLLSDNNLLGTTTDTKKVATRGLGGIGKTTLAAEYAYRYGGAYSGIWWAPAENRAVLVASLAALAVRLDRTLAAEPNQEQAARAGLALLSRRPGLPILLVFDNAESRETVVNLSPVRGAAVLITTRYLDWSGFATELELEVLAPQAAREFLQKRAEQSDSAGAAKLATALGYLPLALDHAGAYCRTRRATFDEYREQIEARIAFAPEGSSHPDSVAATVELAIEKANGDNNDAETLLGFFAFLAPEHIPLDLVDKSMMSADSRGEALAALLGVSLIDHVTLANGSRAVTLHRLVQTAMRNRLARQHRLDALIAIVTTRLRDAFPTDADHDQLRWMQSATLLPHVISLYEKNVWSDTPTEAASDLLTAAADYLVKRGAFEDAVPLARSAHTINAALFGEVHPKTLASGSDLSVILSYAKRHEEAESLARSAVAAFKKSSGADHEMGPRLLNNLALSLVEARRYDDAVTVSSEALALARSNAVGKSEVALALLNLANVLQHAKKYSDAEPLLNEALLIETQASGPDHRQVALCNYSIASMLALTDRQKEALPYVQAALAAYEHTVGTEHYAAKRCAHACMSILTDLGLANDAEKLRAKYQM